MKVPIDKHNTKEEALKFCWGLYYQPKEPDKMREFVAASKRNDI